MKKLYLPLALKAWQTESFKDILKNEICSVDSDLLPLQQGLSQSSYANGDTLSASILNIRSDDKNLMIKAGLFYTGIISGCNCADDPTPVDENNEYCEVLFCIDQSTAEATVTLIE